MPGALDKKTWNPLAQTWKHGCDWVTMVIAHMSCATFICCADVFVFVFPLPNVVQPVEWLIMKTAESSQGHPSNF